jgi:hypothetical protein
MLKLTDFKKNRLISIVACNIFPELDMSSDNFQIRWTRNKIGSMYVNKIWLLCTSNSKLGKFKLLSDEDMSKCEIETY